MKRFLSFTWEIFKIAVIALAIVVPIRYFLFQPFFVKGQSMEPNFENGDYLIVDELSYRIRPPERGEVIVFKYPEDTSQRYIKRIIGLPGETIEIKDGKITIYEKNSKVETLDESGYLPSYITTSDDLQITLADNQYFVLGDNRQVSYDSRRWGPVPKQDIIGRAVIRAWPLASLTLIEAPAY
jgi:signal peptidase I